MPYNFPILFLCDQIQLIPRVYYSKLHLLELPLRIILGLQIHLVQVHLPQVFQSNLMSNKYSRGFPNLERV